MLTPDRERSGTSHSLTLHRPLRIQEVAERTWCVDGTPTDSVLVAVNAQLPRTPDLVVSGVNAGANLGEDVSYSGTVAAALEGTVLGIPSIAVSLAVREERDFPRAALVGRRIAEIVLSQGLPAGTLLNVNVPDRDISDAVVPRLTRLSTRVYHDVLVEKIDPRGRPYYWIGGEPVWEAGEGTDRECVEEGAVSVTPLHLDMTDYRALDTLRGWQNIWGDDVRLDPDGTRPRANDRGADKAPRNR